MTSPASPLRLKDDTLEGFQLVQYSTVKVPTGPVKFGFQIEVTPSVVLSELIFALVEKTGPEGQRVGFGVRIDWERGEIWDAINDSGLVGWMDDGWDFQQNTIKVSFEIERVGSALLPKLIIGDEEWLYPARRSGSPLEMAAVAGCMGNTARGLDPEDVFDEPYAWCGKK